MGIKNRLKIGLGIILLLTLVVAGITLSEVYNEAISTTLYIPEFGHIFCDKRPEVFRETVLVPKQKYFSYTCGNPDIDAYVPDGCDISSSSSGIATITIPSAWICDKGISVPSDNSCICIGSNNIFGGCVTPKTFSKHLKQGQKLLINSNKLFYDFGDIKLNVKSQAYGLRAQESGFLTITNNCDTNSLSNNYHPLEYEPNILLPKSAPINYVIFQKAIYPNAKNLINYNGKQVWIYKPGCYYPIEKTQDGNQYADTRKQNCPSDLVCQPSSLYCSDDGKTTINNPDGKTCNAFSGVIDSWTPIGDNNECKFGCNNGVLDKGECRTIRINECPGETPIYESESGKCVGAGIYIPSDNCKAGEQWIEKETTNYGFLSSLGITNPSVTKTGYCKTSLLSYLPWLLLGLFIILIMIIVLKPRRGDIEGK